MKLRIDPKLFADTVTWAARTLPTRPSTPVLAGLLLEADADQLTVSGFDYDVSVRASIEADHVAEPGKILLPGRVLAEIAKSLPTSDFVDVAASSAEAVITWPRGEFTLPTLPVDDYPTLPTPPDTVGTVDGQTLADAVNRVHTAASRDNTLPMLTGIRLDATGDTLTLAATDRYRIAAHTLAWTPVDGEQTLGVLAHAGHLHNLTKSLTGQVEVGVDGKLLSLTDCGRTATMRLIGEDFIKYEARLKPDQPTTARIDAAELAEAVKRVALVAERVAVIRLAFNPDHVTLRAGGGDTGRGNQTVPCTLEGDPIEISFQANYVLDALAGCGDTAVIGMQAAAKPALFSSEDASYRNLTMALRVS